MSARDGLECFHFRNSPIVRASSRNAALSTSVSVAPSIDTSKELFQSMERWESWKIRSAIQCYRTCRDDETIAYVAFWMAAV
ncbi:hypothetical protein Nepgr_011147 [Nepenthes gracilis]|uniref:Uncharacterized protein n=1 Tax=Nepenthes gracilis TaxID=150966 RepID=A0AAD3SEJ3_NEPGR|nr:hypothetical protein Nepgr_011147 [Nepenthes gracilis]